MWGTGSGKEKCRRVRGGWRRAASTYQMARLRQTSGKLLELWFSLPAFQLPLPVSCYGDKIDKISLFRCGTAERIKNCAVWRGEVDSTSPRLNQPPHNAVLN